MATSTGRMTGRAASLDRLTAWLRDHASQESHGT